MLNLMWLWLPILGAAMATSEQVTPDSPTADCSADHRREAMLTASSPLTFRDSRDGSRQMTEIERLDALERVRARLQKCPTEQQMTACEQAYESAVDGVDGMPQGRGLRVLVIAQRERRDCFNRPRESSLSR